MLKKYFCNNSYIFGARCILHLLFMWCLIWLSSCIRKDKSTNSSHRIIIEAEISKSFYADLRNIFDLKEEMSLRYIPFQNNPLAPGIEYVSSKVKNRKVTWILYTTQPIRVSPPFGTTIIMRPGDSVHIKYTANQPVYTGNNQQSLYLLDSLMLLNEQILKPRKKNSFNAATLEDFLEWNQYLDYLLALQLPVIESYKDKISSLEYEYYKTRVIEKTEYDRVSTFVALYSSVIKGYHGITRSNLIQIWDTTQYKPSRKWLQSLSFYYGSMGDIFTFVEMETLRKFNFNYHSDSAEAKEAFTSLMYKTAKHEYKGMMRERLLTYILDEPTLTEMGLKNPTTLSLLKDYYSQPGYPEYKQYVKGLEEKHRIAEKEEADRKKQKG